MKLRIKINENHLDFFQTKSEFKSYYTIKQLHSFLKRSPKITDILNQWVKYNHQLYDEYVHGFFPFEEIKQYKQIDRNLYPRNSTENIEKLKQS